MNPIVHLKWLLLPALFAVSCFAQTPEKPPCDKRHHGAVWPSADARTAGVAVEICTAGLLKYRWKQATISVEELRKAHGKTAPPPDATPAKPRASVPLSFPRLFAFRAKVATDA